MELLSKLFFYGCALFALYYFFYYRKKLDERNMPDEDTQIIEGEGNEIIDNIEDAADDGITAEDEKTGPDQQ